MPSPRPEPGLPSGASLPRVAPSAQSALPLSAVTPFKLGEEAELPSPVSEVTRLHLVVSSDCSAYQRWQVLVQVQSARSVGQRGAYTWILSGCSEDDQRDVRALVEASFGGRLLAVHFTPDYSNMSTYGGPYADGKLKRYFNGRRSPYGNKYKFNNKPNAFAHWLQASETLQAHETAVLIDPDFLFLRPLEISPDKGQPGRPSAQFYGLGDQWVREFDRGAICGNHSLCTATTSKEVYDSFSVGPPYLVHHADAARLAATWAEFVPRVYDQYPQLYAEMFAYAMAAAHLDLKHSYLREMIGCMVSWPTKRFGERWVLESANISRKALRQHRQEIPEAPRSPALCFPRSGLATSPPVFLHYCQHFTDGNMSFFKRNVAPGSVLDCATGPFQPHSGGAPGSRRRHQSTRNLEPQWASIAMCSIVSAISGLRAEMCGGVG